MSSDHDCSGCKLTASCGQVNLLYPALTLLFDWLRSTLRNACSRHDSPAPTHPPTHPPDLYLACHPQHALYCCWTQHLLWDKGMMHFAIDSYNALVEAQESYLTKLSPMAWTKNITKYQTKLTVLTNHNLTYTYIYIIKPLVCLSVRLSLHPVHICGPISKQFIFMKPWYREG